MNIYIIPTYIAIQNALIILLIYVNYSGVSKYAFVLNALHAVLYLAMVDLVTTGMTPKFKIMARFSALLVLQAATFVLIGAFAMGIMFLGMPFEVEMLFSYVSGYEIIAKNYGIAHPNVVIVFAILYSISTSVVLSFFWKDDCVKIRWKLFFVTTLLMAASGLYTLSITREPYLLSIFGHGFDGAPKDIAKRAIQLDYKPLSFSLEKVNYRPVILVVLDAARGDIFNPVNDKWGIEFLPEMYRSGRIHVYQGAYSMCPVTYCGLLGILRSSYWGGLSGSSRQIQDYLSNIGYSTNFFLSGDHTRYHGLRKQFGGGIDKYNDGSMVLNYPNDDDVPINLLRSIHVDNKTFVYLHLMSTHGGGLIKNLKERVPSFDPDKNSKDKYRSRYLMAARQADSYIKEIFSILEDKNVLNDAIVIITADHGELLGEFNELGHASNYFPHNPVNHIPLIIYDKINDYHKHQVVSQVDVAPTILHAINAEIPKEWSGMPLQKSSKRCAVRSDTDYYSSIIGLVGGRKYKYVKYVDDELVYDMDGDPGEFMPISGTKDVDAIRNVLIECLER